MQVVQNNQLQLLHVTWKQIKNTTSGYVLSFIE